MEIPFLDLFSTSYCSIMLHKTWLVDQRWSSNPPNSICQGCPKFFLIGHHCLFCSYFLCLLATEENKNLLWIAVFLRLRHPSGDSQIGSRPALKWRSRRPKCLLSPHRTFPEGWPQVPYTIWSTHGWTALFPCCSGDLYFMSSFEPFHVEMWSLVRPNRW